MSMYFYPCVEFEIAVDNPGYGTLWIRAIGPDMPEWQHDLAGTDLGQLLTEVTGLATGLAPTGRRPETAALVPVWLDERLARLLLPGLQKAVVLAGAGTDRYEQLLVDEDESPPEPLCVDCGEGSPFHQAVTVSERCTEHGHTPFGHREHTTWDAAQRLYASNRKWWETRRALRLV